MGECCALGSQLRPHVVWFGEAVPMMETAAQISSKADIFLIIGTSLAVYPAASLKDFVPYDSEQIIIDPKADTMSLNGVRAIAQKATSGVVKVVDELLARI